MTLSPVIIWGRVGRKEFEAPYRQCTEMLKSVGVPYFLNPVDFDGPPDFALFFQSYPHEFSQADLQQLRRRNPFAPFFFVLGTCCEGMLRTADPLNSPFYCYVHGWDGKETEQIRRFLMDQPSVFSLPMTAENDEIALWIEKDGRRQTADGSPDSATQKITGKDRQMPAFSAVCRPPSAVSLILTRFGPFGNDSAMNRLIADEQSRLGFETVFCFRPPSAACCASFSGTIFADADDSPAEKILESIQRLRHQFADNDFTVYVDSPRIDEKNAYLQAGVSRVLPKIR